MITNKEKNFVSCVVYTHNNEDTITMFLEQVNNVLKENFEKYEIICINDFSNDNTVKLIESFCKKDTINSITVINTSFFQGVESAMIAGLDMAIGDFVFEFDTTIINYDTSLILDVYKKSLQGNDIVFACPKEGSSFTSKLFYKLFNKYSNNKYKIKTQTFSIISRRGINRVKSVGAKTVYRKAVYASCGLNVDDIIYNVSGSDKKQNSNQEYKKDLATNSLILFTNIAHKISLTLSVAMAAVLTFVGFYIVVIYVTARPIEGWTTLMAVVSLGFFGVFVLLAFILKYLSVILSLIFKNTEYLTQSVQKFTK